MAFDTDTQKQGTMPGIGRFEGGSYTFEDSEVTGASMSLPTKLKHVDCFIGDTEDGLTCYAALGETSNGLITITRCGAWSEEDEPTLHYMLFGH